MHLARPWIALQRPFALPVVRYTRNFTSLGDFWDLSPHRAHDDEFCRHFYDRGSGAMPLETRETRDLLESLGVRLNALRGHL